MKFLIKKKSGAIPESSPNGITKRIRKLEQRCAERLEKATKGYSRRKWTAILAVFVVTVGSLCGMLVIKGLAGTVGARFSIQKIERPPGITETGNGGSDKELNFDHEFSKLSGYKRYLDSMKRNPAGLELYRKIVRDHPGLMDSLETAMNFYESKLKRKQ